MRRVLNVGFDPATVDYSDPALPPGMTAVHRGAPHAAIAFNTRPEDTGAAAARWI